MDLRAVYLHPTEFVFAIAMIRKIFEVAKRLRSFIEFSSA